MIYPLIWSWSSFRDFETTRKIKLCWKTFAHKYDCSSRCWSHSLKFGFVCMNESHCFRSWRSDFHLFFLSCFVVCESSMSPLSFCTDRSPKHKCTYILAKLLMGIRHYWPGTPVSVFDIVCGAETSSPKLNVTICIWPLERTAMFLIVRFFVYSNKLWFSSEFEWYDLAWVQHGRRQPTVEKSRYKARS